MTGEREMGKWGNRDVPDRGSCEIFENTLRNVDPSFGTSRTSVLIERQFEFIHAAR